MSKRQWTMLILENQKKKKKTLYACTQLIKISRKLKDKKSVHRSNELLNFGIAMIFLFTYSDHIDYKWPSEIKI